MGRERGMRECELVGRKRGMRTGLPEGGGALGGSSGKLAGKQSKEMEEKGNI